MIDEYRKSRESQLYLEGEDKIFEYPESKDVDNVKSFVSIISKKEKLHDLVKGDGKVEFDVKIGDEESEDLKNMALVTAKYTVDGKEVGHVGVIGPQRMDYKKLCRCSADSAARLTTAEKTIMAENKKKTAKKQEKVNEIPQEENVKEQEKPAQEDKQSVDENGAMQEMFAKYVRLQADFENYKKRNRETATAMYEEGVADVISDVLPTLDYLEMAIVSQKDESFRQGLELVKKAFLDALSKYGVEEIEALGKEFDPNVHEAAMNRDDPDNAGKVVDVLKKGYIRNGKVLRHPLVVVGQ